MDSQNNKTPAQASIASRHYRSFWPLVVILTLAVIVGGIVIWAAFDSGLQDQINSLVPGIHKVPKMYTHPAK